MLQALPGCRCCRCSGVGLVHVCCTACRAQGEGSSSSSHGSACMVENTSTCGSSGQGGSSLLFRCALVQAALQPSHWPAHSLRCMPSRHPVAALRADPEIDPCIPGMTLAEVFQAVHEDPDLPWQTKGLFAPQPA
jgi:hypothetical protein